jgi:hypothetical protein
MHPKAKATEVAVQVSAERMLPLAQEIGDGINAHPVLTAIVIGAVLLLALLTRAHFKGDYGPETWALKPERNKYLRGLVRVLVLPLRLVASVFSGLVALLVIALLGGFAYVVWKMMHG